MAIKKFNKTRISHSFFVVHASVCAFYKYLSSSFYIEGNKFLFFLLFLLQPAHDIFLCNTVLLFLLSSSVANLFFFSIEAFCCCGVDKAKMVRCFCMFARYFLCERDILAPFFIPSLQTAANIDPTSIFLWVTHIKEKPKIQEHTDDGKTHLFFVCDYILVPDFVSMYAYMSHARK